VKREPMQIKRETRPESEPMRPIHREEEFKPLPVETAPIEPEIAPIENLPAPVETPAPESTTEYTCSPVGMDRKTAMIVAMDKFNHFKMVKRNNKITIKLLDDATSPFVRFMKGIKNFFISKKVKEK